MDLEPTIPALEPVNFSPAPRLCRTYPSFLTRKQPWRQESLTGDSA